MLKCGIAGLPNVGKSTLFNALTLRHSSGQAQAAVANFPFTTIDPNVGVVTVPDVRLDQLALMSRSERVVPTTIEFVDIAGLVAGAHRGEGLGNQFLAHIREVDAIAEVVRFFPDPNVVHVSGTIDPARDVEVISTELALADMQMVDKMLAREERTAKGGDPGAGRRVETLRKFRDALAGGRAAHTVALDPRETESVRDVLLLTRKPVLIVANLDETRIHDKERVVQEFVQKLSARDTENAANLVVPLSVKIEQELQELSPEERRAFLAEYGLYHSGLDDLIRAAYELLGLITFFTTGPKESRAWTVRQGATAPEAAGKIHSDFERGFIRAETIEWNALVTAGSYAAARARGLLRDEGREYRVRDGDVYLFKTNA